jgi:hypothetical protein
MRSKHAGWRLGVSLLLILVASLSVLAYIGPLSAEGPTHSLSNAQNDNPDEGTTKRLSAGQVRVLSHFGLFRTAPEGLPRYVGQLVANTSYGLRSRFAQKLPVRSPARVWAVPAQGMICLVSLHQAGAASLTCDKANNVLADGLSVTFLSTPEQNYPWRRVIVGVAPNGTDQIVAVATSGRTRIEVADNIFVRRDDVPEAPVRLEGNSNVRNDSAP